ncbi:hypothetical protein LTR29_002106 [Friedmanniomyces endolithicus]|nr:hypothetical protein LTR29_002106 [Friedmanniomyces endolithicus]
MSGQGQQSGAFPAANDTIAITQSPYDVGNTLSVVLHRDPPITVDFDILEQHGPSTYSTVLSVSVPGHLLASTEASVRAILKICDRRYAEGLREEYHAEPWSPEKERSYVDSLASGRAAEFLWFCDTDDDVELPEEPWGDAHHEVFLQSWCNDFFNNERRAYECLESLQGRQIPKFLSGVTVSRCPFAPGEQREPALGGDVFDIRGVLIEYIPGPLLGELAEHAPPEHWQYCVDQAVAIVRAYADLPVMNEDVQTRNFIASPGETGWDSARVIMIDFGLCEFRKPDQSDADWGFAKWVEDEEGAIGVVMRSKLKGRGPEITYTPSRRWHEYSDNETTAQRIGEETERGQARGATLMDSVEIE